MKDNKTMQEFANLMIQKIEQVANNWQKPWFNAYSKGVPQNLTGRKYNGMNSLMLFVFSEQFNYKTPVFLTFKQANSSNILIKKGEKSLPVVYWNMSVKNKETGRIIDIKDYNLLSKTEQAKYKVTPFLKEYRVFNIEQTNYDEIYPEQWETLKNKFKPNEIKDISGMFACNEIDEMINNNSWVCKIDMKKSDSAFYSPSFDFISIPLKGQFKDGESFYSTLLHEMAHSTGHSSRLNRDNKNAFGDEKYAKEELIAELTAALTCKNLGISSTIREANAQYLKNWLGALREEPKFILSVLADVNKANSMIEEHIIAQEEIEDVVFS